MLDRVKNGSPHLPVNRLALDRELKGRTCLWAEYTHSYIKLKILIFALCHGDYVYGMLHGLRIPK